MKKPTLNIKNISGFTLGLFLFFIPSKGSCQELNIVAPNTNQSFKLPDPAAFTTVTQAKTNISSAEDIGKLLVSAVGKIKEGVTAAQADLAKPEALKASYTTAITAFDKNDVEPYKKDLDNYNVAGKKYTDQLTKYNKAAQANNALPANKRKAAAVAKLNRQRLQVDSMGKQVGIWKTGLDAAKAKLDIKNAALNKQQQQYQAAEQGPIAKLKNAKEKLKTISSQLTMCEGYVQKCHNTLSKLGEPATTDNSYFTTPDYKKALSDINLQLVSLQFF